MSSASLRLPKSPLLRLGLALLALVLLIAAILGIYVLTEPNDCKMADNVTVGGLDIGGMSLPQAYRAVCQSRDAVLERTILSAELPEETLQLSPGDTKVTLKVLPLLLDAYQAGRVNGKTHTIGLQPYLKLDKGYIRDALSAYAARYDTDLVPSGYELTGTTPELALENKDQDHLCQTLCLNKGLPATRLDQADALSRILMVYDSAFAAAEQGEYCVAAFRVDVLEEPEPLDLDAIYQELYIAPVDDSLDMETYEVIPGSLGYRFDPELAASLLDGAGFNEPVSLSMEFVIPAITGEGVYFRDVLGYCETPHTKDENRNNNLRVACASMNGKILQPGETFSYNETLGPRTKERGYLKAGAYSGWELVMSYGGGICQGSSTLYCASLYADLEILQRVNHGHKVSYLDAGLDATVSWNGPDFQFRNNTHFPIKIQAEVSDGYVKVTLLGTEERDYYVEMETELAWGSTVLYTKTYKCKYDRQTGELISRELENRSNYAL